jgi:hypothetical protein
MHATCSRYRQAARKNRRAHTTQHTSQTSSLRKYATTWNTIQFMVHCNKRSHQTSPQHKLQNGKHCNHTQKKAWEQRLGTCAICPALKKGCLSRHAALLPLDLPSSLAGVTSTHSADATHQQGRLTNHIGIITPDVQPCMAAAAGQDALQPHACVDVRPEALPLQTTQSTCDGLDAHETLHKPVHPCIISALKRELSTGQSAYVLRDGPPQNTSPHPSR